MKLGVGKFIRRFLLHVLPDSFSRIRHYGLFANGHRADKLALCRRLLDAAQVGLERPDDKQKDDKAAVPIEPPPCPCCGGRMKLIESFEGPYPSSDMEGRHFMNAIFGRPLVAMFDRISIRGGGNEKVRLRRSDSYSTSFRWRPERGLETSKIRSIGHDTNVLHLTACVETPPHAASRTIAASKSP
jgi:hypothetical protein